MHHQLRNATIIALLVCFVWTAGAQDMDNRLDDGLTVKARFLYLKPIAENLDYGITQAYDAGTFGYAPYGSGRVRSLEPEYGPGFELALASATKDDTACMVTYSFLRNETWEKRTEALSATNGVPDGGAYDADWARADYNLRRHVFDFDCVRFHKETMRTSIGLRTTYLESEFNTQFNGEDFTGPLPGEQNRKSKFRGAGLTMSTSGTYATRHGLMIKSMFGTGFLLGRQEFEFSQRGWPGADWSFKDSDREAFVPMVEAELGLAWQPLENIQLEAGYEVEHWFNAILETEFADAADEGYMRTERSDLSLHGPYVNFVVRF